MTKDQKLHPGACTCPACSPDLWAVGIKGSRLESAISERPAGGASNADSGSSPPTSRTEKTNVVPLKRNYGTKEHPCDVPPPPEPQPAIPEGAEPLGNDWEPI